MFVLLPALVATGCRDDKKKDIQDATVYDASDGDVFHDGEIDGEVDAEVDAEPDPDPDCISAEGPGAEGTNTWHDDTGEAVVTINGPTCARNFVLSTTATLRHGLPENPRHFSEIPGKPSISTMNDMFDALYALTIEEVDECSVPAIQDGAYNNGNPINCPSGGCFETGRLWTFAWTRDTAYAVDLSLAALDPVRSKNTLEFKLSELRGGGSPQIIQDTGSGGSYPVSSDRSVWAFGAWETAKYLDGQERDAFVSGAFDAISNTIEHDRDVVFNQEMGLYHGEQSFLDWREQSYPIWTQSDTVHLFMSKALSTNVGHLKLLRVGAAFAEELGETEKRNRYEGWAEDLRHSIDSIMYVPGFGLYSTFITTTLDPAPVRHFDLLGTSLAVLENVGDAPRSETMVSNYPNLPKGPSVMWPQQKEIPIYHNRGIWPFVTAYWLRAARSVRNDQVVGHNVRSIIRGTALNLSNMENFECVTGLPWLDDGAYSGPVVNSQRQLWSVAGHASMVHDIIFGLQASQTGLQFRPYLTRDLRNNLFGGADTLVLNNFPYRGRLITVVVSLPPVGADNDGAYQVGETRLNGVVFAGEITTADLENENLVEIELEDVPEASKSMTLVEDTSDYRNLFSPLAPWINGISVNGPNLELSFSGGGEPAAEIAFNIYRDGELVASDLPGSTGTWIDTDAGPDSPSHCYTVEAYFLISDHTSQRAKPWCWWGPANERIDEIGAEEFQAVGGTLVMNYGRQHYESWGEPGHTLTLSDFNPSFTGEHYLQVMYGNGAGPINTGITCSVKRITVWEKDGPIVGSGLLVMPHLGTWDAWADSNFVKVELEAGKTYDFVISHDETTINMSDFAHNELYTGGNGGSGGAYHFVNIAQLKVLSKTGNP